MLLVGIANERAGSLLSAEILVVIKVCSHGGVIFMRWDNDFMQALKPLHGIHTNKAQLVVVLRVVTFLS